MSKHFSILRLSMVTTKQIGRIEWLTLVNIVDICRKYL